MPTGGTASVSIALTPTLLECLRSFLVARSFLFLSVLMAIFPCEPGIAGFIGAKDDGSGGDNWSYKTYKAAVKLSPPTNQHAVFYRPDSLPLALPTVSEH